MSKPLVPWTQDAETELTRIYTDNPEQRSQITAAANAIDRQLSSVSSRRQFAIEIRPDGTSPGFEPPLGVEFVVEPVRVYRVWLIRKPSPQ
jgi:hypothetical protein